MPVGIDGFNLGVVHILLQTSKTEQAGEQRFGQDVGLVERQTG